MNIWTGFRRRSIRPESSYSWLWQKLWMNFFRAGMKDEVVLSEMCEHFRLTYGEHDKSPNGIYFDVVGLFLKQKPQWAFRWHKRLERYPPTLSERFKLFDISMASSMSRRAFFRIYAVLPPVRGAYSVMLPRLCARGLYADAIIWHRLLIGSGDIPSDTSIIKPLLEKLAATGKDELLAEIMFDMVNAGVPMDIAGESSQQEGPVISWQMMNEAHSNLFKIKPRRFSDDFCARLLATKMFSIKTIISGLQILGVDAIGPLALQAIATRSIHDGVCSPTEVLGYIQQLQEAEISIGISKFSRLVRKIAQEGNSGLLYDIVTSDQHPEVLEDQQKQESLLASYDRLGDHRQINRTLAILTLDDEKDFVNAKHWNILLRQDLRLHDPRGLSRTVEAMIESKIPLTATSRSFMREKMMEVRLPGRRPMNEMPGQIIGIWQRAMQSGTFIPVGDWVELLRRLSMAGRFRQYENLAIWLSKWYTDETFRKSQTPLTTDGARSALQYNLPPNQANPKHPFRVLFSTSMQHAVLAWGFAKRFDERGLMNLKQMTFYGRARSLAQSECLRGLRMIASLRDIGVHIDRQQISKMCRVRLRTMFGIHLSRRQRFKSVEWYRQGRWPEYALAMRMIWGPDLFAPTSTSTDLVPKRHSAPQVLADLAQRLKSDAHRRADKLKAERDKVRDKVEKDRNDHQIGSLFLST
ncbi:hypothetical protein MMC13_001752 [Lambiella insularis]|nr:hypothetical protein [Lambiella insularis]